jgi:hypothetical protein
MATKKAQQQDKSQDTSAASNAAPNAAGNGATPEPAQVGPEPLRRITVKTVTGGVTAALFAELSKEPAKPIWLCEILGIARAGKVKMSDYGESMGFIGSFEARDCRTGKFYTGSKVYLPKFLEEELIGIMGIGSDTAKKATFALRIGVKFDMTAATKYVYVVQPLIKPQESDELAMLKQQIASAPRLTVAAG